MFVFIQKLIAEFCVFFMMCYGVVAGSNNFDTMTKYKRNVMLVKGYENTLETAVPQTDIYSIIKGHFDGELPEGKTEKKAIVIGYDGCRADTLSLAQNKDNSAVLRLADTGSLVISYCGGVNYPAINRQATSTAPGWCSMLTGEWASVHGVKDNGIEKSNDYPTLLTTLVEDGKADDSAFYVSWGGHFNGDGTTYILEKRYNEEKGNPVSFVCASGDEGTFENVMNDVTADDCSDFIFSIFEFCDHLGHDTGFNLQNPDYTGAFADAENDAMQIIDAIESRATYETEDWLIIITSDHGGYNTGHGAMSIQERMTFIASNVDLGYEF